MTRVTRRDRVRYWFDRTMSKGTPALIGWLGLASGALVLVVATAAVMIAPADSRSNGHWPGMVWRSLLRTLDPGTMGGDTGTAPFLGLMLVSTIGGIFIVSSLIGVLTTGLESKITELRKGRSRIVEHDHTVLLGWSEQVFTVVAELVEANQSRRRSCVAILADRDKVEMEDAIRARVGDPGHTRIVCRTGDPLKVADVELVSPGTARAIMVVTPEVEESDARVIKVLLSLLAWTQGHQVGAGDPVAFAMRSALELRCARMLQLWAPLVAWTMLARGDIDGIVGYLPEIVDLPAGMLVAAEAGAQLRRLDGAPYELGIDRPPSELGFVAARPELLDRLLETTAKIDPRDGCAPVAR